MKTYIMVLSEQLRFMYDQIAVPELGNGYILPSYWNKWPELLVLVCVYATNVLLHGNLLVFQIHKTTVSLFSCVYYHLIPVWYSGFSEKR
jgi:hypothetical protein